MDTGTVLNFALILLFVLIGGLFAGAEMAIVNLREGQLLRIEASGERGRRTGELVRNPNRFLAAVQIGVTVAGFFSSAYGASTIAPDLVPVLLAWGLPAPAAETVALVGMTLLVAYLSLVLGEMVPKRIAMQRAEATTRVAAPALAFFSRLMKPFVWLLSVSTNAVVRLLGGDPGVGTSAISAEEVRELVSGSAEIPEEHRKILGDVFDAAERTVVEVMRPRPQVTFLAADTPIHDALVAVRGQGHSRYPVYGEDVDDVLGFVHLRDLLLGVEAGAVAVGDVVRPIIPFPGSVKVLAALSRMRAEGQQLALVVDEYGGTDGIVALEDLLEELVGEIYDEYDRILQPGDAAHGDPGAVLVDGSLIVQELPEVAGVTVPDDGSYETVGGYLMAVLGRIPVPGDAVEGQDHRIEVLRMEGRRVGQVRIIRRAAGSTSDPPNDMVD